MDLKLDFVDAQRDRHGRVRYWYFRRSGRRWRLPGQPGSPEFMAEYWRLHAATEPIPDAKGRLPHPPGSFGALVAAYFADKQKFGQKKPNTQSMYRMILEPLAEIHGDKPVALLERRHVKQWRDARGETPGTANMIVKVVRLLMSYAVDNEYRKDNPAQRIELFKLGEHRAWTDEECAAFERRWLPGTMQFRAYMLAKYTGQRCGDIARMTRAHRKGGKIRVEQQQKTGTPLWIFEHRDLAAELALNGDDHLSLLTTPNGQAFDADSLGRWFADAIDEAGLPEDCVLHGLRKTAARMLAEAGNDVLRIMAITGHKSLPMLMEYVKDAQQRTLGKAAILQLEEHQSRTGIAKPTRRPSAKRKPTG
jgi:integrase